MKKLILILSAYLFLTIFLSFPSSVYGSGLVVFEDHFDEGSSFWDILSGDWTIEEFGENKMFGTKVSKRNTVTEALLKVADLEDYMFELKMLALSGADKNLIFRVRDTENRYGIHIDSDKNIVCIEKWTDGVGWDNCKNWSFSNNIVYSLKVVVIKNRILFYVGENLVFDFTDEKVPIYSGTVGLKVSTGATYPSEVYFDDIRITKINTPVVLIPGHGASFNFKEMFLGQPDPDGWHMTPGVRVYDNIITSLEANGYEKNKDLFIFNYNWLNSISDTTNKLYSFIENIVQSSSPSGVKIIGHSMGGLIARACFQEQENECFINQLVTVGSPHRGVLEAYGAWEGGEIWRDGLTKLAFELFLNTQRQPLETDKEALRRLSPALAEMLPDFAYLKDKQGHDISFSDSDYPINSLLEKINPLIPPNEKSDFIFGDNQQTLRWLMVDKDLAWFDQILGNWQFGKPSEKEFSSRGDGTVLTLSAYPDEKLSGRFFDLGHRAILSDPVAVAEIMALLGLKPQPDLEFLANEEDFLVFYLHSPAHLEMVDFSQEALFIGDDSGNRLIIIANPDPEKDYLVNIVGDGAGPYRLTVGRVYDLGTTSSWRDYGGFIESGQTDTFKINFGQSIEVDTTGTLQPIEELFQDLVSLNNQDLVTKTIRWQGLIANDYRQALTYGYRLRNWLALSAKNDRLEISDLLTGLEKIASIIVYLEELALVNEQSLASEELGLVLDYWSWGLLEPFASAEAGDSLSKLAALDYLASNQYFSLIGAEKDDYEQIIYALSGLGLLRNSRILLEEN